MAQRVICLGEYSNISLRRMCILLLLDEVFYKCQLERCINYSLTDFLTIGTVNY